MLKKESERQKSHRVFKWYKARGDFPSDTTTLEAFRLLAKYNYFIAKGVDKKKVNLLTEICNIINREKLIFVHGDFTLDTLYFGLNSLTNKMKVKINYIDALESDYITMIQTSMYGASLRKKYIIYVIDNIEHSKKKDIKELYNIKTELESLDKAIVCCCLDMSVLLKKIKPKNPFMLKGAAKELVNKVARTKKIKLGETYSESNSLKKYIYILFNEENRNKVMFKFLHCSFSIKNILNLAIYNITNFYGENTDEFKNNTNVIKNAQINLYKARKTFTMAYLAYGIIPSKKRRTIRFPPKPMIKVNNTGLKHKI